MLRLFAAFVHFFLLFIYLFYLFVTPITRVYHRHATVHSAVTAGARAIWLGDFIDLSIYLFRV